MPLLPTESRSALALWVGVEPTVSRVGDEVLDQLRLTGFHDRLDDLDRLSSLGAQAVRFPLLWERTAPDSLKHADWRWADARLPRLIERNLQPIVGLVHHGSGPPHTHLLDPAFEHGVAGYARAVAERYPHIGAYTPVNEPLTTARFAGLYGHWYPHARDEWSFWKALMHQLRATVLAMQEIRQVNPHAQLIQTEDLGRVFSTPALQEQADFENERRWLTFDLLLGRVTPQHPMWAYLSWCGASEAELEWFLERPCPPDVLGLDMYVTGERFLDERVDRYPAACRGGHGPDAHGPDAYADVDAVRVRGAALGTAAARLREAHGRYGLPLAVTEAHLNCTREEQLRWLLDTWRAAQQVRDEGVDVRAVTAWAAFGAYEWNSLLTRREDHYESGLWDVRAPVPRLTALVQLARELAAGAPPSHPVLAGPGWWRRSGRLLYPPDGALHAEPVAGAPVLLVGSAGVLGQAFQIACEERGLPFVLCEGPGRGSGDAHPVTAALDRWAPWAVVNVADTAQGAPQLARVCAARGTPLVSFSSAGVFGGAAGSFVEGDRPVPRSVWGEQQRAGELGVLAAHPGALVVRVGALFGPWDGQNFAAVVRRGLQAGRRVPVPDGQAFCATYLPDLTRAALDLLIDGESGLWHLANAGAVTWAGWARQVADLAHLDASLIDTLPPGDPRGAAWPSLGVLGSERGWPMPDFAAALRHWQAVTPLEAVPRVLVSVP